MWITHTMIIRSKEDDEFEELRTYETKNKYWAKKGKRFLRKRKTALENKAYCKHVKTLRKTDKNSKTKSMSAHGQIWSEKNEWLTIKPATLKFGKNDKKYAPTHRNEKTETSKRADEWWEEREEMHETLRKECWKWRVKHCLTMGRWGWGGWTTSCSMAIGLAG